MEEQPNNQQQSNSCQCSNSVITIIITVIITGLIVGGGIYYWQKNNIQELENRINELEEQVSQNQPQNDPMADWKTYRNEEYGYEFKYPQDCYYGQMPVYCKQSPPKDRPKECLCILSDSSDSDRHWINLFGFIGPEFADSSFSIEYYSAEFYNPPVGTNLINWLNKWKTWGPEILVPDEPNMEISGIQAVKIYTPRGQAHATDWIYFLKDDKLFQIQLINVDDQNNRELFDQILSTFKFIN